MKAVRLLVLIGFAAAAFAQYPGSPYPGGGPVPGGGPYPGGGRYPRTTPYPNPGPTGGRQPQTQDSGRRSSNSKNAALPSATTEGMLRHASGNQLVIQADDHRVIWYAVSRSTMVQKDGQDADLQSFAPGDRVTVDSNEDDNGNFTAVSVQWLKAGSPSDRAAAVQTWDLPGLASARSAPEAAPAARSSSRGGDDDRPILRRKTEDSAPAASPAREPQGQARAPERPAEQPAEQEEAVNTRPTTVMRPSDASRDTDDPGPPQLKRGTPAPRRSASTSLPAPAEPAPPAVAEEPRVTVPARTVDAPDPILPQEDPIIQKARQVAESFTGSLPNFFCQQMTTRYQTENIKQGWRALDIVSADVAYEDGRESYKNITVGGKVVNKPMEEIGGTRSTGEFATELAGLMSPQTGAIFRKNGQDTIRGRTTYVYKFEVPRERSLWRIEAPSQLYYPAYRGSIWIDKETSRVLRIEQEARSMPVLFPFDTVETSTDYDLVRLAATEQFLLPVEAEALNCQRGSSLCSRNKIEFRNYRKFGAQSNITFGDAQQ